MVSAWWLLAAFLAGGAAAAVLLYVGILSALTGGWF